MYIGMIDRINGPGAVDVTSPSSAEPSSIGLSRGWSNAWATQYVSFLLHISLASSWALKVRGWGFRSALAAKELGATHRWTDLRTSQTQQTSGTTHSLV